MRFRGLPLDMNCGPVELTPTTTQNVSKSLPACGSCGFVCVAYYLLEGCRHTLCDSCILRFPDDDYSSDDEQTYDEEPQRYFNRGRSGPPKVSAKCSICHKNSIAAPMWISPSFLEKSVFRCPCGTTGNLKELRAHRRNCHAEASTPRGPMTPECSGYRSLSGCSSSQMASSPEPSVCTPHQNNSVNTEDVTDLVKSILLEELPRVEEDVLNRVELRRAPIETQIETFRRQIENLERNTQPPRDMAFYEIEMRALRTRLQSLEERSPSALDFQRLTGRVTTLETTDSINRFQVSAGAASQSSSAPLPAASIDSLSMETRIMRRLVKKQTSTGVLWFNVKRLLQSFNRLPYGESAQSNSQGLIVGGYPLSVNVEVDYVRGRKMLGVFVGTSDATCGADWPMKRLIEIKIYDNEGGIFVLDQIDTTEDEALEFFRAPDSPGAFGVDDLCTIESLTNQVFYRRNHGMVCIGLEVLHL